MISNKFGKFEITTSEPYPFWHRLSLGGSVFPYTFNGDEIYELFYAVNEAIRAYESRKEYLKATQTEPTKTGLTESDVRKVVIETLRELVSGTVENNPEQDADGDEWNNYVFDGVAFVDRVLKSANE